MNKGVKMEFQIFYEVETNNSRKGYRPLPMSAFSEEVQVNIIKEIEKVLKEGADSEAGIKKRE